MLTAHIMRQVNIKHATFDALLQSIIAPVWKARRMYDNTKLCRIFIGHGPLLPRIQTLFIV